MRTPKKGESARQQPSGQSQKRESYNVIGRDLKGKSGMGMRGKRKEPGLGGNSEGPAETKNEKKKSGRARHSMKRRRLQNCKEKGKLL